MSFFQYDLEKMVPAEHAFRKFKAWLPVEGIAEDAEELKKGLGREGYGYERGIRALFVQFYGDHSDREMEEQLRYNMLYRWFCGFGMEAGTPDHTYFCRVRKALGAERVAKIFEGLVGRARGKGLLKGVESFVDASAIKRKEATWEECRRRSESRQFWPV
jgi:IS5 family transposase